MAFPRAARAARRRIRARGPRRIAGVTIALQKRTLLSAETYREPDRRADLHSALCQVPSNKAFETYDTYEAMMLPILEEAIAAMSARRLPSRSLTLVPEQR